MEWRIGCSGFHYLDWKEIFYPAGLPQKKWFEFYSTQFNTLELNVTFYRFPQLAFLQNWYDKSPPGFDFSVKAPRLITHFKKFTDCERYLSDFYGTIKEGLREKLGCVLFQFPSRLAYSPELLDRIIGQLDPSFMNALEFRDASWWMPEVYAALAANKITFCGHSHPVLPDDVVCNNSVVYYRFHGVPKLYYSQYKRTFVKNVAEKVAGCVGVKKAYAYFNNTATIGAIRNAKYLQQLTRQAVDIGE